MITNDYYAEVLADSLSPNGDRLTTMIWTFPRFILAEVNTHKMISKSSASSRAIPVKKRIEQLRSHPFVPEFFSKNQKGMQASENLDDYVTAYVLEQWLEMQRACLHGCANLDSVEAHKQHANRPMEWFAWHTAILTGTDWENLFALRCHPDAQPEFQKIARMARNKMAESEPRQLEEHEWHLPFVGEKYGDTMSNGRLMWNDGVTMHASSQHETAAVSAARCARVSYLTQDGVRDVAADLALSKRLLKSGHMSPFEHTARPMTGEELRVFDTWVLETERDALIAGHKYRRIGAYLGNLNGWVQLRKTIPNERVFKNAR